MTAERWRPLAAGIGSRTEGELAATPAELKRIASDLDLVACDSFVLAYVLKPSAGGAIHLRGTLTARVTQTCVVTLDPLPAVVTAALEAELWPEDEMPKGSDEETVDVLSDASLEPIREGRIDLGGLAFELLSVSLDPYPRKQGATFEDIAEEVPPEGKPLAALAKLKDLPKRS